MPDSRFPFMRDFDEFVAASLPLGIESQKSLIRAFGCVWTHQRVWEYITTQKWPKFFEEHYLKPSKEALDNISRCYLQEMKLNSSTLEWCLINSIVYLTIVEYANSCHFRRRVPSLIVGQPIDGPLLGINYLNAILDRGSVWKRTLAPILGLGLGGLIGAAFNLAFSALFAWAITFWTKKTLITWVVFTASAASTWIVMGIKDHRGESENDERSVHGIILNLLWDLSAAHERLARFDFHVGNVRHLLYRLE